MLSLEMNYWSLTATCQIQFLFQQLFNHKAVKAQAGDEKIRDKVDNDKYTRDRRSELMSNENRKCMMKPKIKRPSGT